MRQYTPYIIFVNINHTFFDHVRHNFWAILFLVIFFTIVSAFASEPRLALDEEKNRMEKFKSNLATNALLLKTVVDLSKIYCIGRWMWY